MYDWVKKDLKDFGNYISQSSDIESLSSQEIDLAFIGAGLSSTYTLIEFVRQIENNKNIPNCDDDHKAYKIAVFEKDSWIWGGIPYGRRSSFTSLIITPLDEFLPEFEVNEFIDWMSLNFSWLIVPFKKNAGERSKQWLLESEEKIISGKSARIHIPRYFFGISLNLIRNKLSQNNSSKILIVGANASALELIYQITNLKGFDRFNISFSVIAPQGKLPGLFIKDKKTDFIAEELQNLSESNDNLTADLILESLRKDLSYADENKYLISDTLPVFTQHVGKLVNLLTKEEKLKFISFHGVEIGRLQRRAGQEYIEPVKDLMKQKKLNIIKGKFISFVKENKSTMVEFKKNNENISQQSRYDIVINCSGSSGLNNKNISPLLNQLKNSGLCTPTSSNHGFIVGDNFDVLPGLYINGPLLAGNVVGDMGIWHVEHCGRIISFAKKIAKIIIENDKFITNQKSIL